jgi:hypothetical protein
MAELFKKPSLQATVSPAGWRSIKVATQQAPVSPLIDLAKTLNVAGQAAQTYAGLQAFEYKQGVKEGEIAAASADLDEAIEGLDTAGEQLIEQGLMPRSQLFGYQKGFRKHIGQREAKSSFYTGLQGRLKEVEMNPESGNYDIIDQIILDEEASSLERLRQAGGSELALQGFAEFSSEIKDRFKIQATQNRDKAIQKFNNNMYIEDFNQEFGERLTDATTPEDIATLQSDLKITMDIMTLEGKIPRSEVVEIFFNGFMVPNVNNLLVGDDPQPDKAEKMLDSMLDIDLTGDGGKLGNINREGAYIRSKAVSLRNSIESARAKIEDDQEENYRDITNLAGPAIKSVIGGLTGNTELDNIRVATVQRLLDDTGASFDEGTAESLIRTQDAAKLLDLMSFYNNNDTKRKAYGRAILPLEELAIKIKTRSTAVLSRSDTETIKKNIDEYVATGGDDISDFLDSGAGVSDVPIIAKEVVAYGRQKEVELEANLWFEKSDAYPAREQEFEASFEQVIEELYPSKKAGDISNIIEREAAPFKEKYNRLIKDAQKRLKNTDGRDTKILEEFEEIKKQVIGNWQSIKQAEKNYQEGIRKRVKEAGEARLDLDDLGTTEEAQTLLETKIGKWWGYFKTKTEGVVDLGAPKRGEEVTEEERIQRTVYAVDLDELGTSDLQSRVKAWSKAELVRNAIENADPDSNLTDLEEAELLIRRKWGFRNPQEAVELAAARKESVLDLDYRETPYFAGPRVANEEWEKIKIEFAAYINTPKAERDLNNFPTFKSWNQAFGVLTKEDIINVWQAQFEVFNNIK